jgi:hypothetical protein
VWVVQLQRGGEKAAYPSGDLRLTRQHCFRQRRPVMPDLAAKIPGHSAAEQSNDLAECQHVLAHGFHHGVTIT